jgi:ATP-dependent RNA helicase DeaD
VLRMPFPSVHPALDAAVAARGYLEPTAVQLAVLTPEAKGRDLLVSARTGSGKTVAFGLAAASTLLDDGALPHPGAPLALVIAPTRELALQVQTELVWLFAGARIASCVGGTDMRREARALAAGCQIVVGTPGRLGDHLRRAQLDLSALKVVVLDEADEMLDLGFQEELEFILEATPAERRTLLFSATIPYDIARLAQKYQRDALRIDTIDRTQPHGDIEYRAIGVAAHEAEATLVNVLRWYEAPRALVFCATRDATRRLHQVLVEQGFVTMMLSGELSQHERTSALDALRTGRARVGVCTDVAARGLDLSELDLVVHADLPGNPETLLHRSGRTGRAGRKGVSVLLVPHARRRRAEQVLHAARVRATWSEAPSAEDIYSRDRERLLKDPMLDLPAGAELTEAEALLTAHPPIAVAAALARLYRRHLPQPMPVSRSARSTQESEAKGADRERARERLKARGPGRDVVQFRIALGRNHRADPKWILPLLCRAGGVSKQDIGVIRIFDTDTRFEVSRAVSDAFAAATANLAGGEPRITLAGEGPIAARPFRGGPATQPSRAKRRA